MANVVDNFNRADGTLGNCSDGVHSWSDPDIGYCQIETNAMRPESSGANYTKSGAYIVEHPTVDDVDITMEYDGGGSWAYSRHHIYARSPDTTDFDDCYVFSWKQKDNDDGNNFDILYIKEMAGGGESTLTSDTTDVTIGTMKASLIGTALKLYVAGVEKLSTTDNTLASGYFGAGGLGYEDRGPRQDDFATSGLAAVTNRRRRLLICGGVAA